MELDGKLLGMGAGTIVVIIIVILVIWLIWENDEKQHRRHHEGLDSDDSFSWDGLNSLGSRGRFGEHDNKVIVLSVIALIVVLALGGGAALYSSKYKAGHPTVLSRTTSRASAGLSNLSGLGRSTRSSVL